MNVFPAILVRNSVNKKYHEIKALNTLILALALGFGLAGMTGCIFKKPTSPSSPKDTLRIQVEREPISLDPTFIEDGAALQIINNVDEGLLGYDEKGDLIPRLAETYTRSSDGLRYEFKLRKDIRWSDGQPIRSQDFLVAFQRALAPGSLAKLAPLLFPIRGARAFHEGKVPFEKLGIHASEDKIVFELESPTSYFLHLTAIPVSYPIRKDILDVNQGSWPESAPSSGPYKLVSHRLNEMIALEKNTHYWGPIPQVSRVEFKVITDESTAVHALHAGLVDILVRVGSLDFPKLKQEGFVKTTPFLATYYLGFNCKKPPFNNVNLRRAVARAIAKEEITEALGSGEIPASSWIPKGLDGFFEFKKETESQPSLQEASLLKTSPYEIAYDDSVRNTRIFEIVQQNLKKKLGHSVTLSHMDWKSYINRLQADPPAAFRLAWMAPIVDPISHLRVFIEGERNNYSGCTYPGYEQLVREIEQIPVGPVRSQKIAKAQKIILEEMVPVVPLYHYVQNTAVAKRVENFEINIFGVIRLNRISLKE